MALDDFIQKLVLAANGEHGSFAGILETDPRLRSRIYGTYLTELKAADPGNALGWDMPSNITKWAWSAAFVSWCMLEAGAKAGEFAFSIRHAVYVKAAIANEKAGTGVFRARPIDQYAPAIGDVIVANRGTSKKTYDKAAISDSYESHGAIVVELIEREGKKFAVTIGGNESDSVRRTEVALTSAGKVRQVAAKPYICVIASLKTTAPSIGTPPAVPAGGLSPAFRKHGTFIYRLGATINEYGSTALFIAALQRAGMEHVWVRIHGTSPYAAGDRAYIKAAIGQLQSAGISVAGWGWCQGATPIADAKMALKELNHYGLTDYVADIEPGHNNSQWTTSEVQDFCKTIRAGLPGSFAVSSFPLIDWHEPHILAATLPYVDAVAPQVYWFNFPNTKMLNQFRRPDGTLYALHDPAEYVALCLDRWRKLMGGTPKPIILTGQAYWDEGGFTQSEAEAKLQAFLDSYSGYPEICGLNWWHFGGGGAMSHAMFEGLVDANLSAKPYA